VTDPEGQVRVRAVAFLAAGLVACAVALLADELGAGASGDRIGWRQLALLVVGCLTVATSAVVFVRPQLVVRADRAQRLAAAQERILAWLPIALVGVLMLVLVWTRLLYLDASLWHDEIVSITTYDSLRTLLDLKASHVLFQFLAWITAGAIGETAAAYRLWSVAPGIAAVAIGTWWAWRRIGALQGTAFATLAVAAPLQLEVTTQARGYGLALLAATLMLVAADHLTRHPRSRARWAFLGSGLLGIWTLVFFAFAFVGQALSLLWWARLRFFVGMVLAGAGALSLAFYAPVLDTGGGPLEQWRDVVGGLPLPLDSAVLLESTSKWLVVPTADLLSSALTAGAVAIPDWAYLVVLALALFAVWALWRRGDLGLALLLLVPVVVFNLSFAVLDLTTVDRHQLPLLTHFLVLVAVGVVELGRMVSRYAVLRAAAAALGVVAALGLAREVVLENERRRSVPLENFAEVASVVRGTQIGEVVTDSVRPEGLRYYIGHHVAELDPEAVEAMLCDSRREFVYIRHLPLAPGTPGYVQPSRLKCAKERGATRVRVPQRGGRGGWIDVWIIRNPPPEGAGGDSPAAAQKPSAPRSEPLTAPA